MEDNVSKWKYHQVNDQSTWHMRSLTNAGFLWQCDHAKGWRASHKTVLAQADPLRVRASRREELMLKSPA
jgi:hypothetical protein